MTERHPFIYNEYDLESARLAGQAYGARKERQRIQDLLTTRCHLSDYANGCDCYECTERITLISLIERTDNN